MVNAARRTPTQDRVIRISIDDPMATQNTSTPWNWAHLGLLAWLPPYAAATHAAGWSPLATLAVHLALTLTWLGVAEWRWPHRPAWRPEGAALRRDGIFFSANVVADSVGGLVVASLVLLWAGRANAVGWMHGVAWWMAVPAAILVSEFSAYWLHRWSHAGGWLWRVHAVHHRPEAVNLSSNLTTHPLNVLLLKIAKLLPLALLGFDESAVLAAMLFVQAQSFATHANVRGSMHWLNRVIGTAELHRRHHGTQVEDALNYSTALPLWDMVFGTYRHRATTEPAEVGVASAHLYPASTDWRGLMALPLTCRRPTGTATLPR
jgi:sterol desaturase/sphingolipid hydroxylase (fatty acid hydroxylase superfamily)